MYHNDMANLRLNFIRLKNCKAQLEKDEATLETYKLTYQNEFRDLDANEREEQRMQNNIKVLAEECSQEHIDRVLQEEADKKARIMSGQRAFE